MKLHFPATDYGDFIANEPSPLHSTTSTFYLAFFCCAAGSSRAVAEKATEKLVKEFNHIRCQATEPLATFLDYITCVSSWMMCSLTAARYGYMIDNIILLITGTLHERDTSELVQRCHPLGMYAVAASVSRP